MTNYYDECLEAIEGALKKEDYDEARRLITQELAMPYIPITIEERLHELKQMLPRSIQKAYYSDAQEIYEAFFINEDTIERAFLSLERSNLRNFWDDVKLWFMDPHLDDIIKKYLLLVAIEQDIRKKVQLRLEEKVIELDLSKLDNFMNHHAYLECFRAIHDKLESDNPSMMFLALELLNRRVFEDFPFVKSAYDAELIIAEVQEYLGL